MLFRSLLDQKEKQILSSDRDDIARFAEANRKLGAAQPGKPRIVFFGDSITQGWRLNEYFPERDFVNRGISGQIAGQLLGRMKADVIDLHPEAVVLLIGTNDIARGVPIDRIEGQIEMLAQLASVNKIKPILCSLLPVSDYHKAENPAYEQTLSRPLGTILALNSWMERYAAQHGYGYANFHAAVVDGKGYLGEESSDDGLHPNGKGYRLMAPVVLAAIEKVVTVPPPATPAKPTGKAVSSKK